MKQQQYSNSTLLVAHRQSSLARWIRVTCPWITSAIISLTILDKCSKNGFSQAIKHSFTITLDSSTFDWLNRQAKTEQSTLTAVVEELLRELADPDNVEGDLIDRLLAEAVDSFPPVMMLEEQAETQEEVLDSLCHRLVETFRERLGMSMSLEEQAAFRQRLEVHAKTVWE